MLAVGSAVKDGRRDRRTDVLTSLRVLRTGNESHPRGLYKSTTKKRCRAGFGGAEGGLVLARFTASE